MPDPGQYVTIRLTNGTDFYTTLTPDLRTLMEYAGGKLVYAGTNTQAAAVGDATWKIKKLFYSGNDTIDVQILTGAWTNRAGLSWKGAGGD